MARYTNKIVLIAGAAGAANELAGIICSEGGKVVVNDPDPANLALITAPVAEKLQLGTSAEDSRKLVDGIIQKHGKIGALVINHDEYKASKKRSEQITVEDYRAVMEGNLHPAFHLMAAIRDHYREAQESGEHRTILILSSVAGLSGLSIGSLYAAAKGAIHGMVRSVAKEYGRFATVNGIAQGFFSEKQGPVGPKDRDKKDYMVTKTAQSDKDLKYVHVAKAAAFLASEDAAMITGQVIPVDGGIWLRVQA